MKYCDCEFYSVEEYHGRKVVHILGYMSKAQASDEYVYTAFLGAYFPLGDFITSDALSVAEYLEKTDKKEIRLSRSVAEKLTEEYFPFGAEEKTFLSLAYDTPCGDYVNAAPCRSWNIDETFYISGSYTIGGNRVDLKTTGTILMNDGDKFLCQINMENSTPITIYCNAKDMQEIA